MSDKLKLLIGIWWITLLIATALVLYITFGDGGFKLQKLNDASLNINIATALLILINYMVYQKDKLEGIRLAKRFLEVAMIGTFIFGFVTFDNWHQGKVSFSSGLTISVISTSVPILILAYLRFRFIKKYELN